MKHVPDTEHNPINLKIEEKINSKNMMRFLKLYVMLPLFKKLKTCI